MPLQVSILQFSDSIWSIVPSVNMSSALGLIGSKPVQTGTSIYLISVEL